MPLPIQIIWKRDLQHPLVHGLAMLVIMSMNYHVSLVQLVHTKTAWGIQPVHYAQTLFPQIQIIQKQDLQHPFVLGLAIQVMSSLDHYATRVQLVHIKIQLVI